jgi:hypothetical protein
MVLAGWLALVGAAGWLFAAAALARRSGGQDQLAVLGDAKSVLTPLVLDDQLAVRAEELAR